MLPFALNTASLLSYGRHITTESNEMVKQIHDRSVNGVKVKCVLIANQENHTRDVCVEGSTGTLVRQSPFLDRELMPVGTKLFPRFLSYVENGKLLAEVQVTELKTTEQSPSSAFEPPAGAVSKPGCWNPHLAAWSRRRIRYIQTPSDDPMRRDSCVVCSDCLGWSSALPSDYLGRDSRIEQSAPRCDAAVALRTLSVPRQRCSCRNRCACQLQLDASFLNQL